MGGDRVPGSGEKYNPIVDTRTKKRKEREEASPPRGDSPTSDTQLEKRRRREGMFSARGGLKAGESSSKPDEEIRLPSEEELKELNERLKNLNLEGASEQPRPDIRDTDVWKDIRNNDTLRAKNDDEIDQMAEGILKWLPQEVEHTRQIPESLPEVHQRLNQKFTQSRGEKALQLARCIELQNINLAKFQDYFLKNSHPNPIPILEKYRDRQDEIVKWYKNDLQEQLQKLSRDSPHNYQQWLNHELLQAIIATELNPEGTMEKDHQDLHQAFRANSLDNSGLEELKTSLREMQLSPKIKIKVYSTLMEYHIVI